MQPMGNSTLIILLARNIGFWRLLLLSLAFAASYQFFLKVGFIHGFELLESVTYRITEPYRIYQAKVYMNGQNAENDLFSSQMTSLFRVQANSNVKLNVTRSPQAPNVYMCLIKSPEQCQLFENSREIVTPLHNEQIIDVYVPKLGNWQPLEVSWLSPIWLLVGILPLLLCVKYMIRASFAVDTAREGSLSKQESINRLMRSVYKNNDGFK
jgi:hypothetical protein